MSKRKLRILLVEDENVVATFLQDLLLELGHEITDVAPSLKDGLAAARKVNADLVILDVNLGGTSSFPVADILCRRNIPFIFLTGYGKAGIEERYTNAPVLSKPFDSEKLSAILDTL